MDIEKKAKTEQLHLRVDKELKDKVQSICTRNNSTLSRVITSLLEQYVNDNDINSNEICVRIPVDKVAHARMQLYALEHGATLEDLMLYATLETIKETAPQFDDDD